MHFLDNFVTFGDFFVPFKQGSSRGAASGESDFEKLHFLLNFDDFPNFFVIFKHGFGRGAASGRPPTENCLKSKRFARGRLKKVKKHHARAPPRAKIDDPHSKINDFGILAEMVSFTAAQAPPTSRAGGQDDGS